jgi:hypothetical protein
MGTSPDAALNESPNLLLLGVSALTGAIPNLDDQDLEFIQARVELEADNRTPEGRGAKVFRKAFRAARREVRSEIEFTSNMLEEVEGAVFAFFDDRGAVVRAGVHEVKQKTDPTIVTSLAIIKDPQLGKLRVWLRAYHTTGTLRIDSVIGTVKDRWGRTLASFGDDTPDDAHTAIRGTIEAFARWAARQ